MTDPLAIAEQLRLLCLTLPGLQSAHLGLQAALPDSPVAEVTLEDGRLAQLPAGGPGETLERHSLVVLFLSALTPNSGDAEREAGQLAIGFMEAVNNAAFDDTLGGITERTRATAYRFDITARNQRAYRVAAVRVESGEL